MSASGDYNSGEYALRRRKSTFFQHNHLCRKFCFVDYENRIHFIVKPTRARRRSFVPKWAENVVKRRRGIHLTEIFVVIARKTLLKHTENRQFLEKCFPENMILVMKRSEVKWGRGKKEREGDLRTENFLDFFVFFLGQFFHAFNFSSHKKWKKYFFLFCIPSRN